MRVLKYAGIAGFVLLLFSTAPPAEESLEQQLTVALSRPGEPYKLNIHLLNGSVAIVGYGGKEIIVKAANDFKNDSAVFGNHMHRHADAGGNDFGNDDTYKNYRMTFGHGAQILAREKNNDIIIDLWPRPRPVNLVIKVPLTIATMQLSTGGDGDITVNNVNGDLEVANEGGHIGLTAITGTVVANTVNGDIDVVFNSVDSKSAMAFSTIYGKIDVTFPGNLKSNVRLKSDHGSVYSDFDIAINKNNLPVNRRTINGMRQLNASDFIYGKIAGGGPEILMKTINGNIYLRKHK